MADDVIDDCPYCDQEAMLKTDKRNRCYQVRCKKCSACGPRVWSAKDAVESWNEVALICASSYYD